MEITQYAKTSKVPLNILKLMLRKKIVSNPLSNEDLCGLKLVEMTWMWPDYLRAQTSQLSIKKRRIFFATCGLKTKWERDAHTRMTNLINAGQDIEIKKMIHLLEWSYQFDMSPFQRRTIYRMRKAILKAREREKNKEAEKQKVEDEFYSQMSKTMSPQKQ